jgi:medium-chain acyl-[acyl-carrier-protein] hydrolase
LSPNVEVLALQLPGRGARLFEEPFRRSDDLIQSVVETILPLLDVPFALFGYSMGALLAFEATRALQAHYQRIPEKIFVAACQAPQSFRVRFTRHKMSEADLIGELRRLNGTPPEILENESILGCFLPALRADFEILDTYAYRPSARLPCSIQVFGGTHDRISAKQLEEWSLQTSSSFSIDMVEGDHFFIKHSSEYLLKKMNEELAAISSRFGHAIKDDETPAWTA